MEVMGVDLVLDGGEAVESGRKWSGLPGRGHMAIWNDRWLAGQACTNVVRKILTGTSLDESEKAHLGACDVCMSELVRTLDASVSSKPHVAGTAAGGTNGDRPDRRTGRRGPSNTGVRSSSASSGFRFLGCKAKLPSSSHGRNKACPEQGNRRRFHLRRRNRSPPP